MREQLIRLIADAMDSADVTSSAEIADYLLENGVIVPPCKIGDTVYYIQNIYKGFGVQRDVIEAEVDGIGGNKLNPVWIYVKERIGDETITRRFSPSDIGINAFFTREEAEAEIEVRGKHG